MKAFLIKLVFGVMTMVICYGILYMFGYHDRAFTPYIVLPIGVAGGHGGLYLYTIIQEAKQQDKKTRKKS
ncbi:hypothetical protein P8610_05245 [Fictibacillus sp. UD]|uniref:hypothetical protein n=1 Tax=Fictibacillus sp. UD TaxID=3038777 RepID=UPI003746FC85